MCGIVGLWSARDDGSAAARVDAAARMMNHRGPDDGGSATDGGAGSVLHVAHRRLSIIDLSSGGHQPMHSEDGRFTIAYNGEVYNYRELRQELRAAGYAFATESDTEVVLAAWRAWSERALSRFVGMFAFCIVDHVERSMILARDGFGIKPLFYAAGSGRFGFASEMSALRAVLPELNRLNHQRAYDYLVFGSYDDTDRSFIAGVQHLLPGHYMRLDLDDGSSSVPMRWWWPGTEVRESLSLSDAADQLREIFLRNVRLHMRSDVRIGAALSGGIDSSAVVCAMRQIEPDIPIHTFSYAARGAVVDEESWADRVNAHVSAESHKIVASADELVADLDDMIRTQGEPFGSTSIYAQYRLFKHAAQEGVTVLLEGQGADELLAGYHGYPGARLRGLIEAGRLATAASFAASWSRWPGRSMRDAAVLLGREVLPPRVQQRARALLGRTAEPAWLNVGVLRELGVRCEAAVQPPEFAVPGRRLAAALRYALTSNGLPALLRHSDRNSMRWSIESRVPFLTTEMAEYALTLPEEYLLSAGGQTKAVFRAAMRGIVPDEILDRRDKIGFATPEQSWLLQSASVVRKWLQVDLSLAFLNQSRALQEFDEVVEGRRRFTTQVWRWINFARWFAVAGVRA